MSAVKRKGKKDHHSEASTGSMGAGMLEGVAAACGFAAILAVFVFGLVPIPYFPRIAPVVEMIEDARQQLGRRMKPAGKNNTSADAETEAGTASAGNAVLGTGPSGTGTGGTLQSTAPSGEAEAMRQVEEGGDSEDPVLEPSGQATLSSDEGNLAQNNPSAAAQDNAGDSGDHHYLLCAGDVTWQEAYDLCRDQGGYLMTLDSSEEAAFILENMNQNFTLETTRILRFYIGARREADSRDYYNIDSMGQPYGDTLTGKAAFADYWYPGEPSFTDGDIQETCLVLMYVEEDGCWKLNDAPEDIVGNFNYYSGTIGYICEYES